MADTFKTLPSIQSIYTILKETFKNDGYQLLYENDNVIDVNWDNGVVIIGKTSTNVYAGDSFIVVEPLDSRDRKLGLQLGKQYNEEKVEDRITIKIYANNDLAEKIVRKAKGMLNGVFAQQVFKEFGVKFLPKPLQRDFNIDVKTGGATVRCLLIEYSMLYSLVSLIEDDIDVNFYKSAEIIKKEIEE